MYILGNTLLHADTPTRDRPTDRPTHARTHPPEAGIAAEEVHDQSLLQVSGGERSVLGVLELAGRRLLLSAGAHHTGRLGALGLVTVDKELVLEQHLRPPVS